MTIRQATEADRGALLSLAQRDSARVPEGTVLVAEVGGELRAAVRIEDGTAVADPFNPTADLVALLRERAEQIRRLRTRPLRTIVRTPARSVAA